MALLSASPTRRCRRRLIFSRPKKQRWQARSTQMRAHAPLGCRSSLHREGSLAVSAMASPSEGLFGWLPSLHAAGPSGSFRELQGSIGGCRRDERRRMEGSAETRRTCRWRLSNQAPKEHKCHFQMQKAATRPCRGQGTRLCWD